MMAEQNIAAETETLIAALRQLSGPIVFVSNEVGLGIVPENQMAREFRDHAGFCIRLWHQWRMKFISWRQDCRSK